MRFYDSDVNGSQVDHYYSQDANFNVVAIANNSGTVQERYLYSAYGQTVVLGHASLGQFAADEDNVSDIGNDVVYTGRLSDSETGLHYYRNRYLDARLGRFVSRDPLQYVAGLNVFEYAKSSPQRYHDSDGLRPKCNKNNLGKRIGESLGVSLSAGNRNPDRANSGLTFLQIASILTLAADYLPFGMHSPEVIGEAIENIINDELESKADLIKKLEDLKNLALQIELAGGVGSVWIKVQCSECKCTTWFQAFRGQLHFAWVSEDPKWVQCDLSKTRWGERAMKGGDVGYLDEYRFFPEAVSDDDFRSIGEDCESQAAGACGI